MFVYRGLAMDIWWVYILIAVMCGIISATLGIGGGVVLVPVLVFIFSLPQKSAQGVCLGVMVPMVLMGAIRYKLNPSIDIDLSLVALLSIGGVCGAWIGSAIADKVPAGLLRKCFAILLLIVAARMLILSPKQKQAETDRPVETPDTEQATQ